METKVRAYYDRNPMREHARLTRPYQAFEFQGTLALFERYLPSACKVCEVGAATGRYSIELLKRGHSVTLYELSPELLAIARKEIAAAELQADAFVCDDAIRLSSLGTDTFDAVLLMGPMYHVIDDSRRAEILKGALTILRPGGILLSAYINSYGILASGLEEFPETLETVEKLSSLLQPYRQLDNGSETGFTQAFYCPPEFAVSETRKAGFEVLSYAGVEGIALSNRVGMGRAAEKNPSTYQAFLSINPQVIEMSPFRDLAGHVMVVARKPATQVDASSPHTV